MSFYNFKLRSLLLLSLSILSCSKSDKQPVDYVNPHIGGIGHLLVATSPDVHWPQGSVRLAPYTTPGITDKYLADKIFAFPLYESSHRRRPVTAWIMATCGDLLVQPEEIASSFDHDFETATPYYYAVTLEDHDIQAECTVTEHCALYRFTFPQSEHAHILSGLSAGTEVEIISDQVVAVQEPRRDGSAFLYLEFSKPFFRRGTWKESSIDSNALRQAGNRIGAFASYRTAAHEQILARIGFSNQSRDQAALRLKQEIPEWNFEAVREAARRAWNRSLQTVTVQGGTEKERIKFFTALYRVNGGEGLWRAMGLDEEEQKGRATAYAARSGEQVVPSHHTIRAMFMHQNIGFIASAYLRGLRGFDVERAYANMKMEFMECSKIPWRVGPPTELDFFYLNHGFFPALPIGRTEWVPQVDVFEKRQSVTVTLQAAYESWCLAQMARELGKDEECAYFSEHARDYQKVYRSELGFMAPRTVDGRWVAPFDPKWSGGLGGRDYFAENNSWSYTWYVPHDVQGLIDLMGGRENFIKRLDALFVEQYDKPDGKFRFLAQFPDETGLIGQYSHGNEFTRHIPYLYNYAGAPWKAQRRIRQIMDVWYGVGPLGLCGAEDSGLMSQWFVFAAIGLSPANLVCPNYPVWLISSPIFKRTVLKLPGGGSFTIRAENSSAQNKYIQSAKLNGMSWDKPWFDHSHLRQGGSLELVMGAKPNRQWGSAPESAPPSFSSLQRSIGKDQE